MSNFRIFQQYLQEIDFPMEEYRNEDGLRQFETLQRFKNGGEVTLMISFHKNEQTIGLHVLDIAKINSPLRKEAIHSLLNELNTRYDLGGYIEQNGNISLFYPYYIPQNQLDPQLLFQILVKLFKITEENYPKFMKLQWG